MAREKSKSDKLASVGITAETGTVLLKGPEGDVRLVWDAEGKDRVCTLPAGEYAVRTIRTERTREGTHWFLSTTGPAGEPKEFKAGRTRTLKVPTGVVFKGRAKKAGEGLALGFALTTPDGAGISVYKEDRRVKVTYEVLDRMGKSVAEGTMTYG
ncbi:MAG: hypothetical protein ACYTG4_06465 [Planctomycetota bacterium]|jgi:hypothetical protein